MLFRSGSSSNAEFVQGVKRMYGADRLKKAIAANKSVAKSPDAARAAASKKPVIKPVAKSADEARMGASKSKPVSKQVGTKPSVGKLPYYYTEAEKAYVKAYGKPKAPSFKPSQKPTAAQVAYGKSRAGGK